MVATVRLVSGGFEYPRVDSQGRFEVDDGILVVLGTSEHGDAFESCRYFPGEWREAWLQNEGQPEQFGHVTAGAGT